MSNNNDSDGRQAAFARLTAMVLDKTPSTTCIATVAMAERRALSSIFDLAMKREDARGVIYERIRGNTSDPVLTPTRLCWLLHTSKTLEELVGSVKRIKNIGELIDAAYSDPDRAIYSSLLDARAVLELTTVLGQRRKKRGVLVCDAYKDRVARGMLSSRHPYVIMRITNEAYAYVDEASALAGDVPSKPASSQPPPLN